MKISECKAHSIALEHFKTLFDAQSRDLSNKGFILEREYEENDLYYAYFFNTRGFLIEGQDRLALIGHGPIVVSKKTGAICPVGSHDTWQNLVTSDDEEGVEPLCRICRV